jgi:hypothetical protein
MSRGITTRLRKLEANRPQGLEALRDAELYARIESVLAELVQEHSTAEGVAASFRADGNETAARYVEEHHALKPETRLRKLEDAAHKDRPRKPVYSIIAHSAADEERQTADLRAQGADLDGDPGEIRLIVYRIVDSEGRFP